MSFIKNKCPLCSSKIDASKVVSNTIECLHCGEFFTLAKESQCDGANVQLQIAENEMRTCDFDKAYEAFACAIQLDSKEPEAYFGMMLAKYGVQYLVDEKIDGSGKVRRPICHRVHKESALKDKNYLTALSLAAPKQKKQYQKEAEDIEYINKYIEKNLDFKDTEFGYAVVGLKDKESTIQLLTIPSSYNDIPVKKVEDKAFYGCKNLIKIVISPGVAEIGNYAFYECSNLTDITIPISVTRMGEYAFWDCKRLSSIKNFPTVSVIEMGLFQGCSSLASIVIPSAVTKICGFAFADCTSLTSVNIPSTVTTIETWAFARCSRLTKVVIPSSVTQMGRSVFSCCDNLTVYTEWPQRPVGWCRALPFSWNFSVQSVVWNYKDK